MTVKTAKPAKKTAAKKVAKPAKKAAKPAAKKPAVKKAAAKKAAAKKPAAKAKPAKPAKTTKTAADKKSVKGFLAQVREAALQSEFYSEAFNALDELLEKETVNGSDIGAFTQKVFLLGVAAGTEASIL